MRAGSCVPIAEVTLVAPAANAAGATHGALTGSVDGAGRDDLPLPRDMNDDLVESLRPRPAPDRAANLRQVVDVDGDFDGPGAVVEDIDLGGVEQLAEKHSADDIRDFDLQGDHRMKMVRYRHKSPQWGAPPSCRHVRRCP